MGVNFNRSDKDRKFFESVVNESISATGIDIQYLTVAYNSEKDKLYAEDTKPLIDGRYKMTAYTETIEEEWILSRYGFSSPDDITIHIGKKTVEDTIGQDPKEGDFVYIDYMARLFVITDADQESNIFQQQKFVWNIHLTAADINGEELGDDINFTDYEEVADVQNDNDTISEEISGFLVEKSGDTDRYGNYN